MATSGVPTNVQSQIDILNANMNKLVTNRERLIAWFDDGLGASVWSLLSASNKTAAKNALVTDMQTAVNNIQAVVNNLSGLT